MRKMYCARHEEMVEVFGWQHLFHDVCSLGYPMEEEVFCLGPFYTSAPVELPEDWELNLTEPSPEEMALMDENAESLVLEMQ